MATTPEPRSGRLLPIGFEQPYATGVSPVCPTMPRALPRRTFARTVVLILFALGLVGGCDSGKSDATEWASKVCRATAPWKASIGDLTTQAQQQIDSAGSAAPTKQAMVSLLSGAEQASEAARQEVDAAGVPDADGGAALAQRLVDSLQAARDAYAHARMSVQALPTGDAPTFYSALGTVMDTLSTEYAASALDTTALDSPELTKAFAEAPGCQ